MFALETKVIFRLVMLLEMDTFVVVLHRQLEEVVEQHNYRGPKV